MLFKLKILHSLLSDINIVFVTSYRCFTHGQVANASELILSKAGPLSYRIKKACFTESTPSLINDNLYLTSH